MNDWIWEGILLILFLLFVSGELVFGDLWYLGSFWLDIGNGEFSGDVIFECLGDWLLLEFDDVFKVVVEDVLIFI